MNNPFNIKIEEIFNDKFGSKKRVFRIFGVTNYTRSNGKGCGKIGEIRYNYGLNMFVFESESPSYLLDVKSLKKIARFMEKLK